MPRVKAIANFYGDVHLQGDVFDIEDAAEAQRLVDVNAVVIVADDEHLVDQRPEQEEAAASHPVVTAHAPATPVVEEPVPQAPVAPVQPSADQIAQDLNAVENPATTQV